MNPINEKDLSAYYKAVEKSCPRPVRKRLSADLKESVSDFLEDNKGSTIDDIKSHFGEPAQFASEYIASLDDKERKRLFKKSKTIVICVVSVALTAVLILGISAVVLHFSKNQPAKPLPDELRVSLTGGVFYDAFR